MEKNVLIFLINAKIKSTQIQCPFTLSAIQNSKGKINYF